jgi:hypothetical protein
MSYNSNSAGLKYWVGNQRFFSEQFDYYHRAKSAEQYESLHEWAIDSDAEWWNQSVNNANESGDYARKSGDYTGQSRYDPIADYDESFKYNAAATVERF